MRKGLIFMMIGFVMFFSCKKSGNQEEVRQQADIKLEKVAEKYTYDQLKQMLYYKEKQTGGLVGVDYRMFKPFWSDKLKIRIYFSNKALATAYKDFVIKTKFIAPSGTQLGERTDTVFIIVMPQQTKQYVLSPGNYPAQTSDVIVNLIDYKPVFVDSVQVDN